MRVAIEVQVGVRALGLLDHHLLGVDDQADRRQVGVGEQRMHAVQPVEQRLARVEDGAGRHGHAGHAAHHGAGDLRDAPLHREDLLQPPAGAIRYCQETQRLAGWRAIDNDRVEVAGVAMIGDPKEAGQLVHARQYGQLLGHHVVQSAPGKQRVHPILDDAVVAVDVVVDVGFLRPEIGGHLHRLGA